MCVSDFKTKFELKLKEITKSECSALISDTRYDELIKEVEQAKVNSKKTSSECRRLNRFDVLTIGYSLNISADTVGGKTNNELVRNTSSEATLLMKNFRKSFSLEMVAFA
ncbi:hypothetical protein QTP88_028333 [Uroleucon formosanum]